MPQVIPARSVQNKVFSRIKGHGRGWVFTPTHFLDLGPRKSVDMALTRLTDAGSIRRLARGLYDFPQKHPKLGLVSPTPDTIARTLSDKDGSRLLPSGAYAANLLGLSTQVPARIVYLTDATTRTVTVGKRRIQFRHTTPKNMATSNSTSGLVIQAFRYLGVGRITDRDLATLKRTLPDAVRMQLWKDRVFAPAWMHPLFQKLRPSNS